jgi:hypothetical protein
MKLVDLKRTPKEKKEEAKEYTSPASPGNVPDYSYGTCLSLDEDLVAKLLGDELPEVGAEFEITARGKVTSVRQSASEKTGDYKGVEIQITQAAFEPADDKKPSIRDELEKAAKK